MDAINDRGNSLATNTIFGKCFSQPKNVILSYLLHSGLFFATVKLEADSQELYCSTYGFYNSKNLSCIGALFSKICLHFW